MPLIEIVWADGCVSRREMDAIMKVAEAYGLVEDEAGYREVAERLLSRPAPNEVEQIWGEFQCFIDELPNCEREIVTSSLLSQAQFIAEQGAENIKGFLRGERICPDANDALCIVAERLKNAKNAVRENRIENFIASLTENEEFNALPVEVNKIILDEAEKQKAVDNLFAVELEDFNIQAWKLFDAKNTDLKDVSENKPIALVDDLKELIPLVPLVKVAWAEGRITRRERELIFNAAERMGIESGSPAHERLESWLELHPTDDFYSESLDYLSAFWSVLPEDEKSLRRLDLLSDCVNIAEASGGTSSYPAGGRRVCDEEFAAVKRIAEKLNTPSNSDSAPEISLAA